MDRLTAARHNLNSVNWAVNPQNKTKQNKRFVAVIDYGITLSYDYLSQKIINNVPMKC